MGGDGDSAGRTMAEEASQVQAERLELDAANKRLRHAFKEEADRLP